MRLLAEDNPCCSTPELLADPSLAFAVEARHARQVLAAWFGDKDDDVFRLRKGAVCAAG